MTVAFERPSGMSEQQWIDFQSWTRRQHARRLRIEALKDLDPPALNWAYDVARDILRNVDGYELATMNRARDVSKWFDHFQSEVLSCYQDRGVYEQALDSARRETDIHVFTTSDYDIPGHDSL